MREIAKQAKIHAGDLSKIERGIELPRDEWVPALELAYGADRTAWYSPQALLAIQEDESG